MSRSLQDVYIYGENSVTLLGADSRTLSNTYLIQLELQAGASCGGGGGGGGGESVDYGENGAGESIVIKSPKEANLLMIKAEKLAGTSIVKCLKKVKSNKLCVSSSRKVAALVSVATFLLCKSINRLEQITSCDSIMLKERSSYTN